MKEFRCSHCRRVLVPEDARLTRDKHFRPSSKVAVYRPRWFDTAQCQQAFYAERPSFTITYAMRP